VFREAGYRRPARHDETHPQLCLFAACCRGVSHSWGRRSSPVAGIVYAAALPFVGLVTAYVYFDARTRVELEPVVDQGELPAEIELARG
jgi:hypothetical protein